MDKSVISIAAQENLKELAAYLKDYAVDSGEAIRISGVREGFVGFDINRFYEKNINATRYECGAVACAVGHFALMRGHKVTGMTVMVDNVPMGWVDYSESVIGIIPNENFYNRNSLAHSVVWDWVFSANWRDVDNTALGVVARTEQFLEDGIPSYFTEEVRFNDYIVEMYEPRLNALKAALLTES